MQTKTCCGARDTSFLVRINLCFAANLDCCVFEVDIFVDKKSMLSVFLSLSINHLSLF